MPVNEYGQMIGESMEGYTPGELPSIDFLEGRYARIEALSVESMRGFISCLWSRYSSGDVDLPLSGAGGRYGGTGYRLKSDVGS